MISSFKKSARATNRAKIEAILLKMKLKDEQVERRRKKAEEALRNRRETDSQLIQPERMNALADQRVRFNNEIEIIAEMEMAPPNLLDSKE